MNNSLILKTTYAFIAAAFITQTPALHKVITGYENYLYQRFDVVNNAVTNMREIKKDENPYKICKTYSIGKNSIKVKTETHYSDYRKKSHLKEEVFHVDTSSINAKTILFVYNSKKDKDHITQTIKGSNRNTRIALNKNPNKLLIA